MRVAAVEPGNANIAQLGNPENVDLRKLQATALIATNDPEIYESMSQLLAPFSVETVWSKCLEEVKYVLARQKVSVCFCGFWLLDGTYRDVVRHLRLRRAEVPAVIVCSPSCPHDYRDYLAKVRHREDFEFRVKRITKTAFADPSNFRNWSRWIAES